MKSCIDVSLSSFLDQLGPASPTSEERAVNLVGTLISGRYQVEELLGRGGMGAVYRGEQIHLRKQVAIKVLHPEIQRRPELVERFEREAVAGAHVQHPNVAAAIDFGELSDGSFFLVLEFIEGTALSTLLDDGGPLPAVRALRIARQMAAALEAVHAIGIIHRDVKPQNTLLGPDDHVKLIDFGLARVRLEDLPNARRRAGEQEEILTGSGAIFGTPAYLAPEASLGMDSIDARSDLFALGVTLYEMLCGRRPFDGDDAAELFFRLRVEDPPSLRARVPEIEVPEEAERVAMRLVQRAPQHRYGSATETIAGIDEALAAIEARARPEASAPVEPPGPVATPTLARLQRWVPPAAFLVGALLAVLFWRPSTAAPGAARGPSPTSSSASVASAPMAPASSVPVEIDGQDLAGWRARLEQAAGTKNWVLGARAFLALVRLDPALLEDEQTRVRVIGVASGIAHEGKGELSDAVFDALTKDLGTSGLDVLYDLVISRGGTRGGHLAREILLQPAVQARESPALRVGVEFFVASCDKRRTMLDRAASDGDRRMVQQLEALRSGRCSSRKDPCCFNDDPAVVEAIARLRARLPN